TKKRPQIQARQGIGLGRERKRQLLIPADTGKSAASRLNQQNRSKADIDLANQHVRFVPILLI
ncbi:MAG: hypothetical protein WBE01_15280, partial [Methyloceanibacter sp.]